VEKQTLMAAIKELKIMLLFEETENAFYLGNFECKE